MVGGAGLGCGVERTLWMGSEAETSRRMCTSACEISSECDEEEQ